MKASCADITIDSKAHDCLLQSCPGISKGHHEYLPLTECAVSVCEGMGSVEVPGYAFFTRHNGRVDIDGVEVWLYVNAWERFTGTSIEEAAEGEVNLFLYKERVAA